MLNLWRLRILQQLDLMGSMQATADSLQMTRPAVAQQLARLEEEAGDTLTYRDGRRTALTASGRLLLTYAQRMLEIEAEAEASLTGLRRGSHGQLRIGAFGTAASGLVPPLLERFDSTTVDLAVVELDQHASLRALSARQLDLAVIDDYSFPTEPLDASLAVDLILEDAAFVAVPATHPRASAKRARLEDFQSELWILNEGSPGWHHTVMQAIRSRGFEPRLMHGSRNFGTSLALVSAGVGVSVQPGLAFLTSPPGVAAVPVAPRIQRRVLAAYRKGTDHHPLIRQAITGLRQISAAVVSSGED
jgi:DNA-binding transcriptional LysR family regulator